MAEEGAEPPEDIPTLTESGLARSIRSLFDEMGRRGAEPATPGAPDPDPEAPPVSGRGSIRDRFTTGVARYLRAAPDERDRLVVGILDQARRLRRAQEIRAVSDAAVTLALHGQETGDDTARGLALELMDAAVTSHLAVRLAMDEDERVRASVGRVSEIFPGMFAPALADALPEAPDRTARRAFMDAILRLGEEGRKAVVELLEDPRWYAVRDAVQLLSEMGSEEVVQDLTSGLAHDDPRLRCETLRALAGIGGEAAGLLILGMLEDPESEVRAAAADGAGTLRLARAQQPLVVLLERETEEAVVVAILRALGRIRDPASVSTLEKHAVGSLFSRPARAIRIAAFRALAEIGSPQAMRVLEAATSDRDREIRSAVKGLVEGRGGEPSDGATPESGDLEDRT